jgi:hypothetical protein
MPSSGISNLSRDKPIFERADQYHKFVIIWRMVIALWADELCILSCVFNMSRRVLLIVSVILVVAAGLPQLCCAVSVGAGSSNGVCAMCGSGHCNGCPFCAKGKECPMSGSPQGKSDGRVPGPGLCQQTTQPVISKSAGHHISFADLLPNFHAAVLNETIGIRPDSRCLSVDPGTHEPPTLLSLHCALLI